MVFSHCSENNIAIKLRSAKLSLRKTTCAVGYVEDPFELVMIDAYSENILLTRMAKQSTDLTIAKLSFCVELYRFFPLLSARSIYSIGRTVLSGCLCEKDKVSLNVKGLSV